MKRTRAILAISVLTFGAWLSPACGGDSESDSNNNTVTGGAGGSGGAILGGAGGTDGGGTGGTSPDAGKCVAKDCPSLGQFAQGCCKPDDSCGYDGSAIGLGCVTQEEIMKMLEGGLDVQVPPDAADPNCDDFSVGSYKLEGCCPSTGFCGLYDPLLTKKCYDWNELPKQIPKPDNIVPKPCGPNAGDAATDASSDVSAEAATDAGAG